MASAPKKNTKKTVKKTEKTEKKDPKKTVKKVSKKTVSKKAVKKSPKKTVKKIAKKSAKKTVRKSARTAKPVTKKSMRNKRKTNLLRVYKVMSKLCHDAVDKEVLKRFKTLIDTAEEDITKINSSKIIKDPENFDIKQIHEAFQPYIKHYVFMLKRININNAK